MALLHHSISISSAFNVFGACFRGSALQRRLKEREKEMEADERDRQREKEEIEDVRRRLLEEGHEDVDHEIAKVSNPLLFVISKTPVYQQLF